jgi:drug/metabolite transporter (DMT)-like permease
MEPPATEAQPTEPASRGTAEAFLVVSALAFGTLAIFGKLAYGAGINIQSLLAIRFTLAGLLVLAFVALRRPPLPGRGTLVGLVVLGAAGYVGQSAAYFNSLRFVPAAVTAVLLYTYPAIVSVLSVRFYGTRLGWTRALPLGLALAGTVLIVRPGGGLRWEGVVLGLTAAVVYTCYILLSKRVIEDVEPMTALGVITLSAGAVYSAFTIATGTFTVPTSATGWFAILGLVFVATILGAGSFLVGLRRTDPGRASLISTLEPVSTTVLAALVFGELLAPIQLLGAALVIAAVALVSRPANIPAAP